MVTSRLLCSRMVAAILGLAFFAVAGCRTPRTEVIVVVDTDLRSGPTALDSITIRVTSPEGLLQSSMAALGPAEEPLPRTLGLVHTTGPLGPFRVEVEGLARGGRLVSRDAVFTFVARETRTLVIHLLASCVSTTCGIGQTCDGRGCRSVDVGPGELLPWTGTLPGLDASVADAPAFDAPVTRDTPRNDTPVIPPDVPPDLPCVDGDGDTFVAGPGCVGETDCDDTDPLVFPRATEPCNGVDDDCDSMTDEDFDTDTDVMHCGACNDPCDFQNSTGGTCVAGSCMIGTCNAGFADCNRRNRDGCEVDLSMDDNHCNGCGMRCIGTTRVCCMSVCSASCP